MELWQFYIAFGIQFLDLAMYGVVRSLASKCVRKDETGKIISTLALIAAIVPLIAYPTVQTFYNKTLDTFPAAEILLSASILLLTTFFSFFIYTQRWRITSFTSENNADPKNPPKTYNTFSNNDSHLSKQ